MIESLKLKFAFLLIKNLGFKKTYHCCRTHLAGMFDANLWKNDRKLETIPLEETFTINFLTYAIIKADLRIKDGFWFL